MTINERIRFFRKEVLHLNQRQFASDLGMAQTGISGMERDGATVTDRAIRAICLAYGVSEEWLRNGTEPMYAPEATFSLDKFVEEHGASELDLEILRAYFTLPPDIRKAVLTHFKEQLSSSPSPSQPAGEAQEAVPTAQLTPVVPAERPRRTAIVAARNGIRMEIELTCTDEEEEAAQPPPIVDCDI